MHTRRHSHGYQPIVIITPLMIIYYAVKRHILCAQVVWDMSVPIQNHLEHRGSVYALHHACCLSTTTPLPCSRASHPSQCIYAVAVNVHPHAPTSPQHTHRQSRRCSSSQVPHKHAYTPQWMTACAF
eukprot:1242726-Prymnesium_polylepis.1